MALFETLVVLMLAALPLLAAAHRFGLPYPTLLAAAGALFAAMPFAPRIDVDPKLALVLFVAPALLRSSYEASPRELYRHRISLFMLAILAVCATTSAVAILGHAAAGLPLAAAVVLGAIVAPPDAAASGAVLSAVGLPKQGQLLLEGESLLNDASSLLLYGFAVVLAVPDQAESGPLALLLAVPGGVLLGAATAWIWVRVAPVFEGSLSFSVADILVTFGIWLLADAMKISPVLTIVTFGILLARHFTRWQPARDRIQSTAVWRALVLALNASAFLLLGLQAKGILATMSAGERIRASIFAGAVLSTVVLVRIGWVMFARLVLGVLHRRDSQGAPAPMPWTVSVAIGWAGMRGVVTLAAAYSLPAAMPQRGPITLAAYAVVFGTLVIQGITLGPLIRWLGLGDDGSIEREVATVRRKLSERTIANIAHHRGEEAASIRLRLRGIAEAATNGTHPQHASSLDRLWLDVLREQEEFLEDMGIRDKICEETYRRVLLELDWAKIHYSSYRDNLLRE